MKKILIAGAVLVAAGVGYYVMKPGGPGSALVSKVSSSGPAPLDYVPADTAFVVANVESMPKDVTKAWMEQFASISGIYATQAKMLEQQLAEKDPDAKGLNWLRAIGAEMTNKKPDEVMADLGLNMQLRYAAYEVAAKPVIRLELADAAKTRAFIARIEAKAGEKAPTAKVDALDYWNFEMKEEGQTGRIVIAIDGSHLVMGVLPKGGDDADLRKVFGLTKPASTLAAAGTLTKLNKEMGYTPYTTGYVDTRKVIALIDADLPAADAVDTKAACAKDFDAIAAAMPRFVFGYTELQPKSMKANALLELRADIAKDMASLAAPMPGLNATAGSVLNFGFAFNLDAVATFVNKQADAIIAAPYTCPALIDMNDGATQAKEQINNPMVFASASAFSAIHVIATKFTMPQAANPDVQPEFAGKLLIGSKSPAMLLGMLGNFVPQVATLNLKANELKEIPADPSMPVKGPMFALMTDNAVGVSVGEGESASLKDALAVDADSKTLMAIGYGGAFFKSIFEAAAADAANAETPEAAEMKKTMEALQKVYADAIDRIDMQVRTSDRGIEFVQVMRLK